MTEPQFRKNSTVQTVSRIVAFDNYLLKYDNYQLKRQLEIRDDSIYQLKRQLEIRDDYIYQLERQVENLSYDKDQMKDRNDELKDEIYSRDCLDKDD